MLQFARQNIGKRAAVTTVSVNARADRVHGIVAEIALAAAPGVQADDVRADVARALGHFTIHYVLAIADGKGSQ